MALVDSTSFHLFAEIPKDIRLIIWAYCVSPRIITLSPAVSCLDFSDPPSNPCLLAGGQGGGGEPPYKHFEIEAPVRPIGPYYTAHFVPLNCVTPPAMQSCKEARDVFESLGYKSYGKVKNFVWNPKIDMVFLAKNPDIITCTVQMFQVQFPAECKQIPGLGIYRCFFGQDIRERGVWRHLVKFESLKKLVSIVVEKPTNLEHEVDRFGQWVYKEEPEWNPVNQLYLATCRAMAESFLGEKYKAIVPPGWSLPQIIVCKRRLTLQSQQIVQARQREHDLLIKRQRLSEMGHMCARRIKGPSFERRES